MNPTVSILVPSYHHARFLRACLASVAAQTLTAWELILVDDGSTDESVELAGEIAACDPRMKVEVNAANLGTYGTLQRALEMASAPYVAVLNSDDVWAPEKLEQQVRVLETVQEAGLCYTHGVQFGSEGEQQDVHGDWPIAGLVDLLPHLLAENRILASSVLFRRDRLRFETTCRYSGDWVALLEQSWEHLAACVPEPLTRWRVHGANTFTQSPGQVREEIRVRQAIAAVGSAWNPPSGNPSPGAERSGGGQGGGPRSATDIRHGLATNALHLMAAHVYFGERGPALRAASASLRLAPSATAWKRLAALALPMSAVRQRLWGSAEWPPATHSLPPLTLRRP